MLKFQNSLGNLKRHHLKSRENTDITDSVAYKEQRAVNSLFWRPKYGICNQVQCLLRAQGLFPRLRLVALYSGEDELWFRTWRKGGNGTCFWIVRQLYYDFWSGLRWYSVQSLSFILYRSFRIQIPWIYLRRSWYIIRLLLWSKWL